jgi:hypothetical protein
MRQADKPWAKKEARLRFGGEPGFSRFAGSARLNDPAARVAIGLQFLFCCPHARQQHVGLPRRRRGREAEGGGLLNRYTVKSRIEGSNPSVSAIISPFT